VTPAGRRRGDGAFDCAKDSRHSRHIDEGEGRGKLDLDLYVLSADGYDDIEIALPTEPSRRDFTNRIGDAIETLAAVEQRPPEVAAEDIRYIGCDRVFSRIPDSLVVDDPIHLEIAAHHIRDMRRLLPATATTELAPLPSFARAVPRALEYADGCRFGGPTATSRRSFMGIANRSRRTCVEVRPTIAWCREKPSSWYLGSGIVPI
jgi:hypothetical protein